MALLFGGSAIWFLWLVWNLGESDGRFFGEYHVLLTIAFAVVAGLAFKCVPDFLAVRGLCVLLLLTASPLLGAAYMHYDQPPRLFMVTLVYVLIAIAIWLGVQPYRLPLRDFFTWLFQKPGRTTRLWRRLASRCAVWCWRRLRSRTDFSAVPNETPVLLVVAGPAGSGKSTLCDRLVQEIPGFARVVTTTTRAPRPGEVDGVHYHFLSADQFDAKLAENAFLEWAWVHGKRRYGTLAQECFWSRCRPG